MSDKIQTLLENGIQAEYHVIKCLNQEFNGKFNITHKKTRGVDLVLKSENIELKMEVKSANRYVKWYCKKRNRYYKKYGAFAISCQEINKQHYENWYYAFVIKDKAKFETYYVNGQNLVNYLKTRVKPKRYYRVYINQLFKCLNPKTNFSFFISEMSRVLDIEKQKKEV